LALDAVGTRDLGAYGATMAICIIPARGGSKRIPRKNIRAFCGKPLLGWVIETAKASQIFDEIYLMDRPVAPNMSK